MGPLVIPEEKDPHWLADWSVNELLLQLRKEPWCTPQLLALLAAQRINGAALTELSEDELRCNFFASSKQQVDTIIAGIRELAAQNSPAEENSSCGAGAAPAPAAGSDEAHSSEGFGAVGPLGGGSAAQSVRGSDALEEEIYALTAAVEEKARCITERGLNIADRERRRLLQRRAEYEAAGVAPDLLRELDAGIEQAALDAKADSPPAQPPQPLSPATSGSEAAPAPAAPEAAERPTPGGGGSGELLGALAQDSHLFLPSGTDLPWAEFASQQLCRHQQLQQQHGRGRGGADVSSHEGFAAWLACGMPASVAHLLPPRGHLGRRPPGVPRECGGDPAERRRYKLEAKRREWMRRHGVWASEKKSRLWRPGLLEEARRHSALAELAADWDRSENPEGVPSGGIVAMNVLLVLQTFFYWSDTERDEAAAEGGLLVDARGRVSCDLFVTFVEALTCKLPPAEFDQFLCFASVQVVAHVAALQERGRRLRSFRSVFAAWDAAGAGRLYADDVCPVLERLAETGGGQLSLSPGAEGTDERAFCESMVTDTATLGRKELDRVVFRLMRCVELQQVGRSEERSILAGADIAAAVELVPRSFPAVVCLGQAADPAGGVEQLAASLRQPLESVAVREALDVGEAMRLLDQRGITRGAWVLVGLKETFADPDTFLRRLTLAVEGVPRWRMHRSFMLFVHVLCDNPLELPPLLARRAVTIAYDAGETRDLRLRRGVLPAPEPGSAQQGSTRDRYVVRVALSQSEKEWR